MTLIASQLNKFGIVQASDSNLTNNTGNVGFGQKIFPISHLNASLSYSGTYFIDGRQVDEWMNEFITGSFHTADSIEEFTNQLAGRMTSEMREHEIETVSIVHVGGYQKVDHESHLEHWHISNSTLQPDGNYSRPSAKFVISNDFNSRTRKEHRDFLIQMDVNSFNHTLYINGFPEGRMSYMHMKTQMDVVLNDIWNKEGWGFRPPENLFESSSLLKLYFNFILELFKLSNHNALFIGGEIQTNLIPAPQDLCKNNWS